MSQAVRFCGVFLILLLASAGTASARPAHVGGAGLAFLAVPSGMHAFPVSAFTHSPALLWGDGDDHDKDHDKDHDGDRDRDHDRDHDKDHDKDSHGPKPSPEPSTILSFGAALLIGGGVFYSRRLRRSK